MKEIKIDGEALLETTVTGKLLLGITQNINNTKCTVSFGYYWDDFEETWDIGEKVIKDMIMNGGIKGSTYIEVMATEYGVPVIDLTNEDFEDFTCESYQVKDKKLLQFIKDNYVRRIDKHVYENYDNVVCVVRDDPQYSHTDKNYVTSTVIINPKKDPYIINIGYPREKNVSIQDDQEKILKKVMKKD